MSADLVSASATALQTRVLGRVREEIDRQVHAVDEALRQIEGGIAQDLRNYQQADLCTKWKRVRERRDAALEALDQQAMNGCNVNSSSMHDTSGDTIAKLSNEMAATLADIRARHIEMQLFENQLSLSTPVCDGKSLVEQLERLRQQRILRPRILFSHAVSSRTGQGLHMVRGALTSLMDDQRLFPHVGGKVPLNYSMLEHLAHAGRDGDPEDGNTIDFLWASFCKRRIVTEFEVVMCQPEQANAKLSNADQLVGKMAVAKRGGCCYGEKAQHAMQAGALGLVVVNTVEGLLPMASGMKDYFYADIPVVMISSKDADALLLSGHSSALRVFDSHPDWDQAVTKHVVAKASPGLRAVCSQACVSLGALEDEASHVGMDKQEVLSALRFLHATGSVLHYGLDTRRGNFELHNTVFMQPQFIIDAIKRIVREPNADKVNEELRQMDTRIRRSPDGQEALDRFLGSTQGYGSGIVTRSLLTRHLWRDFAPRDHEVLLQLMQAFKLLRPLAETNTFLVPAMLPNSELPAEYVTPHWWCPSKASAAAVMRVEDVSRRAEMRVMYKVLGGRLPFGFISELQVSLAQTESVDPNEELHFAPEAAVIDRISGSVLSAGYKRGGGSVREWVILSRERTRDVDENGEASSHSTDCIRVMGWVELSKVSVKGATDWLLFRRVMQEIEGMEQKAPGLCLQKMVLYVNADAKAAIALKLSGEVRHRREVLLFKFEDGTTEDVDVDIIIPSDLETTLTKPQCYQPRSEGVRHRVDAFFAKKTDDNCINVHAEAQLMARIVMDPGCGWDCSMNPQPTIEDLRTSIASARQRNVRILHLAGHGQKECGFIWNADDAATSSRSFDVDAMSLAIGSVAGQQGPMECAVLNACTTETMGRLLRQHGVPCVVCWKTPVQDETAKELCERFYRALVEDASGNRDYERAFLTATSAMLLTAHTKGPAQRPHTAGASFLKESLVRTSSTRNASVNTDMMLKYDVAMMGQLACGGSNTERVQPWHTQEDVVLFLSHNGDSDPICLWRERLLVPLLSALSGLQPAAEIVVEESIETALKAAFQGIGLGAMCADVCSELGVECVDDLAHVREQDVDELPKYIKDKLKPVHKRKLLALIASAAQTTDSGAQSSAQVEIFGSRPHTILRKCRVFLGYRVASDADLVERLHDKLKAQGMDVWWDKCCLQAGQPWEEGFADGLCSSDIFVPILSKAALASFAQLTEAGWCDNVLLEHQLALELRHRGDLQAIFPVLVGECRHDVELGDMYGDFFKGGGMPTCLDVRVLKVEDKLKEHLQRLGKGTPKLLGDTRTVSATIAAITSNQGVKLIGIRTNATEKVVAEIVKLAISLSSSFT